MFITFYLELHIGLRLRLKQYLESLHIWLFFFLIEWVSKGIVRNLLKRSLSNLPKHHKGNAIQEYEAANTCFGSKNYSYIFFFDLPILSLIKIAKCNP